MKQILSKKIIFLCALFLFFVTSVGAQPQIAKEPHPYQIIDNELLVTFKQGFRPEIKKNNYSLVQFMNSQSINSLFNSNQVSSFEGLSNNPRLSNTYLIKCQNCAISNLKENLEKDPNIQFVDYSYLAYTTNCVAPLTSNDPNNNIGVLDQLDARRGWQLTTGNNNIRIAIIDQTHDAENHYDLSPNSIFSRDYTGNTANTHGHQMAGTASARTNNGTGVASVGHSSGLMFYNISAGGNFVSVVQSVNAIYDAIADGADVINLSFYYRDNGIYATAIQDAINAGVVVIVAAGNNGTYNRGCNNPGIICVTAVNQNDEHGPTGHVHDPEVDLSAPHGVWQTTYPNNGIGGAFSGTSFSAALTSGTVALMRELNPTLVQSQTREILMCTSDDISNVGNNSQFLGGIGAGRLNVYDALNYVRLGQFNKTISGPDYVCEGYTYTYTLNVPSGSAGCYDYTWHLPSGWQILYQNNNSITVQVGSPFYGGAINAFVTSKTCNAFLTTKSVYPSGCGPYYQVVISPNPARDIINVEIQPNAPQDTAWDRLETNFEIITLQGNSIKASKSRLLKQQINLRSLENGTYLLKVVNKLGVQTKAFHVEK